MRITGTTQVYFIIGDPVAQVRAPELYNPLFQRFGIDAVLVPLKLAPADLPGFLQHGLAPQNVGGLWATIPHKAQLASLCDVLDPVAQVAAAANVARRRPDGRLEGALFDGLGFVKGLDFQGIPVTGRRVLVVGTGGGGHAVAAAIAQRGPQRLGLYNRTAARAESLRDRLLPLAGSAVHVEHTADATGYDLVINCTSQGLKPGDALPVDPSTLEPGAAVVDIIMSRQPTPLLQACAARGITAHAGFEMLVQQVPEYLRFFGYEAAAQAMEADLSGVRAQLNPS